MEQATSFQLFNVYAHGTYTLAIQIGSEAAKANLILDTGSSTLVVQSEDYNGCNDRYLAATPFAQSITYGLGGWYGPVVKSRIKLTCTKQQSLLLDDVNIAIAIREHQHGFAKADGILGLAYYKLNKAYDLSAFFQQQKACQNSYPNIINDRLAAHSLAEFKQFIKQYPREYLTPYFTRLKDQGAIANQFAFSVHRSSIYHPEPNMDDTALKQEPLNQGEFILGFPRQRHDLYQGEFQAIKVLDDKYYNVHVNSIQVAGQAKRQAPLLREINKRYRSNGIIDSGASGIVLPHSLLTQLIHDLEQHDPSFAPLLEQYLTFEGVEESIPLCELDLNRWPDIHIELLGLNTETVTLTLRPEHYWQCHAPEHNRASFQFVSLAHWPNQCILGLPVFIPYYVIFDRRETEFGAIFIAEKPA